MIRSCRTYTPPSKEGEGERILFLRYSALGDILIVTPYCRALKERYPRSYVTWLANAQYVPFLREQPYIDSVLPWDTSAGEREFLSLLRRVGRERFTRLVSLHSSDRGALIALFSKTPLRFCNASKWGALYDTPRDLSFWTAHDLRIPEGSALGYVVTPDMRRRAASLLGEQASRPCILGEIGASKDIKRWPAGRWKECKRDGGGAVLGQPVGGNKAGRPGPDDDGVKGVFFRDRHESLLVPDFRRPPPGEALRIPRG